MKQNKGIMIAIIIAFAMCVIFYITLAFSLGMQSEAVDVWRALLAPLAAILVGVAVFIKRHMNAIKGFAGRKENFEEKVQTAESMTQ